jgi:hypothetical protein
MIILKKFKSIYKLLLVSILATFTVASSANSIELEDYYGSISVNQWSGKATQDDGGNWSGYSGTPAWDMTEDNIGINFGKYFNSSANSRQAIEINYIPQFQDRDQSSDGTVELINYYKDIVSVDMLYLRNFSDEIEYFGSIGLGVMEMGGNQVDGAAGTRNSEHVNFMTFGGGLLFKHNEMFDFKLSVKKYMDTETSQLVLRAKSARSFGFEDVVVTTAAIVYNF